MKKITFTSAKSLADFMATFVEKSTATFEVVQLGNNFVLTFLGGF